MFLNFILLQKPYACQVTGCGKRYTDPSSLRKHVKNHAEPTPGSSGAGGRASASSSARGNANAAVQRLHQKPQPATSIDSASTATIFRTRNTEEIDNGYRYDEEDLLLSAVSEERVSTPLDESHNEYIPFESVGRFLIGDAGHVEVSDATGEN